jgi:carboxyl-terminal processing protease
VRLTVQRPGVADEWQIDVARASIKIPVIESRMIGDLGYIHLAGFPTVDLPKEFQAALMQLRQQGAKALVLDLRGNSGGRLDVGTQIASYLLPQNTPLYRQTTRRGQTATMTAMNQRIWDRPMVALVDDATASMGEILAAALQEDGTTLIGITTAGSVAGSIVVPLSDGSALQITTLRIDSGQGTRLNTVGVQPDLRIEQTNDDSRVGRDHPLDTAVDVLHTRLAQETQSPSATVPNQSGMAQPAGAPTPIY